MEHFFGTKTRLTTPSLASRVLPGITRRLLLQHGNRAWFTINEQEVTTDTLHQYAYCFATNAIIGLMPITTIHDTQYDAHRKELTTLKQCYDQIHSEAIV